MNVMILVISTTRRRSYYIRSLCSTLRLCSRMRHRLSEANARRNRGKGSDLNIPT